MKRYTIGAFLAYRAFEFLRNDICLQKQNVKIVGTGAGEVYSALGPTHHATEDLGGLRATPGLTIFSPASPKEAEKATRAAYAIQGPVYIRLGTNREPEIYEEDYPFIPGRGVLLRAGADITAVGTGSILADVLEAGRRLEREGISLRVINMHTIKPFDQEILHRAMSETKGILTVEDHNIIGGLGSAVSEVIAETGKGIPFQRLGLKDCFSAGYGSYTEVKDQNGIGVADIAGAVRDLYQRTVKG